MNRRVQATLALVAVISFGLYILGCTGYAAWNADSSKLLIPYYSPEAKEWGVALYDLKTHASRKLMAQSSVDRSDMSMQAQWVNEATDPFLVMVRKINGKDNGEHVDAYLVPLDKSRAIRSWVLPSLGENVANGPFTELGGKVFIPASSLAIVDTRAGSSSQLNYDENEYPIAYLATDGRRLFYVRGQDRPAPTAEDPKAVDEAIQFGELTVPDLKRVPWFEILESELKAQGVEVEEADLFVENGGTRLAMFGKQGEDEAILIFNSARLERTLVPKLPDKSCSLGGVNWTRSDLMFAIVGCPAGEGISQISLAEISSNDGTTRLWPILRMNSSGLSDFIHTMKPSLAPNGGTLAVVTTVLDDKDVTPDNRALFLVDMQSPDRHVTRIAIPGVTRPPVH